MINSGQPIYAIIQIAIKRYSSGRICPDATCVGFTYDLDEALGAVKVDQGGLNEAGYFAYVLVEKRLPGIYNIPWDPDSTEKNEWWHTYNSNTRQWVGCDKPKEWANIIAFM